MLPVNPPSYEFWKSHVILNGRSRDYHVANFPGPLSIKSVLRGSAVWQTSEGCFELRPGSSLIINDRQTYSITVDSREIVETLCVFFAAGFVEDVHRSMTTADRVLLDEPVNDRRLEFEERLLRDSSDLTPLMRRLQRDRDEDAVTRVAERLVSLRNSGMRQATRLPAAKPSTRAELLRRVNRGRNIIEGSLSQPLTLSEVARQAALSPYHFHRSFTRLFGESPGAYATRRRMEYAAELLRAGDTSITDICSRCGYESPGSFSALFRRYMGATPTQFRRLAN